MRKLLGTLAVVALLVVACGGSDSDDSESAAETQAAGTDESTGTEPTTPEQSAASTGEPPPGLPPECVEAPFEINVDASSIAGLDGPFPIDTAYANPQPIVPDPDQGGEGGNEQTQDEFLEALEESKRLAAETDLLLYSVWLADFPFDESEIAFLGGPDPRPGGTVLGLTIVPTDPAGFVTGDVISGSDEFTYETFTSFLPMTSYLLTDLEPETFMLYSGEPTGSATVLYIDEDWICLSWEDVASTRSPDGDITISGVMLAPLTARQELPFN